MLGLRPHDAGRAPEHKVGVYTQLTGERITRVRRCNQVRHLIRMAAGAVSRTVTDRHVKEHRALARTSLRAVRRRDKSPMLADHRVSTVRNCVAICRSPSRPNSVANSWARASPA